MRAAGGLLAALAVLLAAGCVTITPVLPLAVASPTPSQPPGATTPSPGVTMPTPTATAPAPSPFPSAGDAHDNPPTAEPTINPTSSPTTDPTPGLTANPNDPACLDDAYSLEGYKWTRPLNWFFNEESTPAQYDREEVLAVIERAFANITEARNDCGIAADVSAEANYLGHTTNEPCTEPGDEFSVVGFGKMPRGTTVDTIAYTCPYTYSANGKAAAADIVISDAVPWALSLDDCNFEQLLEPVLTHEIGHAFGLGHVSERKHPYLTMSTIINGACENDEATLGLGDVLGLEELYPAD